MASKTTMKPSRRASAPTARTKVPEELPTDVPALFKLLEKVLPASKRTKELDRILKAIRSTLKGPKPARGPKAAAPAIAAPATFSMMDLLRKTFSAQDLLFLRKQVTYHIAASAGMPNICADVDRIQAATASLLEYMAMHAPRGSRIDVKLKEIPLRSGSGIEISFQGHDATLRSVDKTSFLHRMYESDTDDGHVLINCRELVSSQGGQLWADLPKPHHPIYRMVLPAYERAREHEKPTLMYKYDISIQNYANVRKRFGIKKSLVLVGQIEMYVRALVRHPIDIVTAVREKGVITTIYESPKGAAQSVASRISQRLGAEEFRIGKKPVDLLFRYQLSQLPSGGRKQAS